jgi:DNA-3-methyladenine glycosylase
MRQQDQNSAQDAVSGPFSGRLPREFYARTAPVVAKELLGCLLVYAHPEGPAGGRISEVEAYTQTDPASHAYPGPGPRNAIMFGPPGHAYIYFTYGAHFCMNAVAAPEGCGEGVLIRAVEPLIGLERMAARRGVEVSADALAAPPGGKARIRLGRALCAGPGRVCRAFGLTRAQNGADLTGDVLWIAPNPGKAPDPGSILATPRIGITRGADTLWRFTVRGDPYVSGPRRLTVEGAHPVAEGDGGERRC